MLWYKVWLETRARFLISLAGMTVLCAYLVYGRNHDVVISAPLGFYYSTLRLGHQLLNIMWLGATTLLMMGGLLQEKANGSAPFTLAFPVSRARLMNVRICAGLIQAAVLILVPWTAMYAASYFTGPARSLSQVLFYVVLLASGGAVFFGTALLVSSLIEGTYTAPMLSAAIVVAFGNAPKSLVSMNPLDFIGGHEYLGQDNLAIGPIPWGHAAAYLSVAALLIVASVKAIERRDF